MLLKYPPATLNFILILLQQKVKENKGGAESLPELKRGNTRKQPKMSQGVWTLPSREQRALCTVN